MGGMTFVDLRDRYGITQLAFNEAVNAPLCEEANKLGREYCIQIKGVVNERQSKNNKIPTGDIEIVVDELSVLSPSLTPPFTIEDNTDGGDDLRMKYRYLDLRRPAVRRNMELRHRMTILIRNFLDQQNFIEVETPILIGSTPEGARDFVVPSRPRLPGAQPSQPRPVLRPAAVAPAVQAAAHGGWLRPLLPDSEVLPRRGPARRPPAGVYADRLRDVVRGPGGCAPVV